MAKLDISSVLKSTGVSLEREATRQFGNAVEDFARGALGLSRPQASGISLNRNQVPKASSWDATSYAAALAGATQFRPKLKFLFKVQFFFTDAVISQPEFAFLQRNQFTFMIKTVDRPKVDFEYEDDINLYNYRTKVLKKIRHRELTVTFMDDTGNNVFDFFRTMMLIYSPVTRDSLKRDNAVFSQPNTSKFQLGSGMEFSNLEDFRQDDVAHRAMINNDAGSAIRFIRVKQIFLDASATGPNKDSAVGSVHYDFVNPRIVSFDLDDLSHELSDPNLLTMQFDYDWLEMTKNAGITNDGGPEYTNVTVPARAPSVADTNLASTSSGVTADILRNVPSTDRITNGTPIGRSDGGGNPFLKILSNAAGRVVTKVTSDVVNKAARTIAGNGRFANSIGGRLLTTAAGNVVSSIAGDIGTSISGAAISSLAQPVSGLIGAAKRDQISGLGSTVNQSSARAHGSLFSDSTVVGNVASIDTSRAESSSDFYRSANPIPDGEELGEI